LSFISDPALTAEGVKAIKNSLLPDPFVIRFR